MDVLSTLVSLPSIEFYDTRHDRDQCEWGQFISSYFLTTFLEVANDRRGICLEGGNRIWDIDEHDVSAGLPVDSGH